MKNIRLLTIAMLIASLLTWIPVQAGTIKGKVTAKKNKYLPHTLIYIEGIKGEFKASEKHEVMDQKNLVFIPHVLPVLAGTTVDFLNSDEVAHNVFTPDKEADKFNLGTWPAGEIRSYTFEKRCDKVCDAVMLCNVHPEMEAFVVIMESPYFSMADDSGSFQIDNVPEGSYTLTVWHPKLKAESQAVEVSEKGTIERDFKLNR